MIRKPLDAIRQVAIEDHRQQVYDSVSAEVRRAIEQSGRSQRDIAAGMNIATNQTVVKALAGNNVYLSTLADIAFSLGKRLIVRFED